MSRNLEESNTSSVTFNIPISLCDYAGISLNYLLRALGDISWNLVSDISRVPVYSASRQGNPCYLGFLFVNSYAEGLYLSDLQLGDPVTLTASLYADAVESRLTCLARLSRAENHSPVTFNEIKHPSGESLYFHLGMIWIARKREDSNIFLVKSVPDRFSTANFIKGDFDFQESVLSMHEAARNRDLIFETPLQHCRRIAADRKTYLVSKLLDLNGVKLLYFANYVTIYDSCLSSIETSFHLNRNRFKRLSLLYYGNADAGESLKIESSYLRNEHDEGYLTSDVCRMADNKLIGIFNVQLA